MIKELFESRGAFFTKKTLASDYYDAVMRDIVMHTSRYKDGEFSEAIEATRPNENDRLKEYRRKADRQITGSGFREFLSKCNRIIRQSNLSRNGISDELKSFVDSKPFTDNGENLSLESYAIDVILRQALGYSPNQVLVAIPVNPNDRSVFPIKMELNEQMGIEPMLIPHENLRYGFGNLFFTIGKVKIKRGQGTANVEAMMGADNTHWYYFHPYYEKSGARIDLKYKMIPYAVHNTGESLMNFLPGERATSKDGRISFKESYLKSYFDFSYYAAAAISDDFVLRSQYTYPITEISPVVCKSCEGTGYKDKKKSNGECQACAGQGYKVWPSLGEAIVNDPNEEGLGDEQKQIDRVKFYNPDIRYAETSFKTWQDLVTLAKQSIGLDLLNGTGNESGVAKDLRMETLQDKLSKIAAGLYECIDRFLWQCECILQPHEDERIRPVTVIPQKLSIKDTNTLKEEAENALPENRIVAHREYYASKYMNDPLMLRMHELLLDYSPIFVTPQDELNVLIAKNIIGADDLTRKLYATQAIEAVIDDMDIHNNSSEDIFAAMDDWLISKGLIADEVVIKPASKRGQNEVVLDEVEGVVELFLSKKITASRAKDLLKGLVPLSDDELNRILESEEVH